MKNMLVSIVIASYCRPRMLWDTLRSLAELNIPEKVDVEVLVIDNDPAGSARSTIEELQSEETLPYVPRYIHEVKTGLSYARNRGIDEANGEIIAFLDDDVFVSRDWLASILTCFERTDADSVGGRTLIHWESEPEEAVRLCERETVALDMGEEDFEIRGRKIPGGGNAAFRKSVFASGLRFSTELGRIGKILLSGEDSELFARLKQQGKSIWYCAGGTMYHRIGGERITAAYLLRQKYWFGISYAIIDYRLHGKLYQVSCALARLGKALLIEVPRWLFAVARRNKAKQLLAKCSLAKQWGYLRATLARGTLLPPKVTQQAENCVSGHKVSSDAHTT